MREHHLRLVRHQEKLLPVDHTCDAMWLDAAPLVDKKVRERQPDEPHGSCSVLGNLLSLSGGIDIGTLWPRRELVEAAKIVCSQSEF